MPSLTASSTRTKGQTKPSENIEWVCKSAVTMSLPSANFGKSNNGSAANVDPVKQANTRVTINFIIFNQKKAGTWLQVPAKQFRSYRNTATRQSVAWCSSDSNNSTQHHTGRSRVGQPLLSVADPLRTVVRMLSRQKC